MRQLLWITVIVVFVYLLLGCARVGRGDRDEIKVMAPYVLRDILETAARQFQAESRIAVKVICSSIDSVLDKALSDSSIDLVISPLSRRFGQRQYKSRFDQDYVVCPFRLSMVVASRSDNKSLADVLREGDLRQLSRDSVRRIVINDPDNTYEGHLALKVLDHFHLISRLQPKLIVAQDRQQLLSFLETGEADAGIVLETTLNGRVGLSGYLNLNRNMDEYLNVCGAVAAHSRKKEPARAYLDLFDSRLCEIYRIVGVYQR